KDQMPHNLVSPNSPKGPTILWVLQGRVVKKKTRREVWLAAKVHLHICCCACCRSRESACQCNPVAATGEGRE
ncbi:hypothetical protein PENTCL1PPCAC_5576, partial [Pristionchus entomophagus]